VRDLLRAEIVTGVHSSGRLPSEEDLVKTYAVSRAVIRSALELLREEGLIERARGAGTFVVVNKSTHDLDHAHDLAEQDGIGSRRFSYRLLAIELVPASPVVAAALQCEPSEQIVLMDRLTELDGEPFTLTTHYLAARFADAILHADLSADFYRLLEQELGVQVDSARLMIEAVSADEHVAQLLKVAPGSALLLFQRLIHDVDGNPVAFGFNRMRGDRASLLSWLKRLDESGLG
jgi:GntR family transcriptional regulator